MSQLKTVIYCRVGSSEQIGDEVSQRKWMESYIKQLKIEERKQIKKGKKLAKERKAKL